MGNDFNPDHIAGKTGQTHYQPTNYADHAGGVAERDGRPPGPNWGGGGGGGGIAIFALMFAPILILGVFLLVPLFPVAGTITAVVGYLFQTFVLTMNDVNDSFKDIVTVALSLPVLLFAMRFEEKAATSWRYWQVRHWIRVFGGGLALNEIGLPMLYLIVVGPQGARGWSLYASITPHKLMVVALCMLGTHLFFRWLDTRGEMMSLTERFGPPRIPA